MSAPHPPSKSRLASRPAIGLRARSAARPLDPEERAAARTVALGETESLSLAAVVAALPDPSDLPPGTLVLVPAEVASPRSIAKSVLAVFGRTKTVAVTRRSSALLARGYVDLGADEDGLVWGRAPAAEATGPSSSS